MCSLPEPQKTLLLPVHPAGRRQYDPFSGSCFLYIPFWRYCRRENALNAVCVPQAVPQNNCKTALKKRLPDGKRFS